MAQAYAVAPAAQSRSFASWQTALAWVGAVAVALLFFVAGIWKMVDPIEAGAKMAQAKVPGMLSEYAAVGFGAVETLGAALLLIPRFRRMGAWLTGLMLVAFMVWIGYWYQDLVGKDRSCFPWLKRAIGPGFFIGDAAMLLGAIAAGWWAQPMGKSLKLPAMLLAGIAVFGVGSYAYNVSKLTGAMAPESVTLTDGSVHKLREGRQLVYFFDPQCMHCFQAAQQMSKLKFGDTQVVAAPTEVKQFGPNFLKDTGFPAKLTNETEKLRAAFPFGSTPYLVLIDNGRQKTGITNFDPPNPSKQIVDMEFAKAGQ